MICLSQLQHVPIFDNQEKTIGRLQDVVININGGTETDYPKLTGIIFKIDKNIAYIPYQYLENLGPGEISLNANNCWQINHEFLPEDVLLRKDLLDQQIFDVAGIRVVRVNDLQLIKIENRFCLVGIDISAKGILRRLGVAHWPLFSRLEAKFIDWHNVTFIKGAVGSLKLKTSFAKLEKLHPADIANLIENLTLQQSSKLVQAFNRQTAAEVLGEVKPIYKESLLAQINPQRLAEIIETMPIDQAVAIVRELKGDKKTQIIHHLHKQKAEEIRELSSYSENTAGGLMTSEFVSVPESYTAAEAIHEIRQKSDDHRSIYHVFVLNEKKQLRGVVSIRTLLISPPHSKIRELMSPLIKTVRRLTKAKEVARLMTKYNLLSVAVTDRQKILHGIITVDDIMRFLVPNA